MMLAVDIPIDYFHFMKGRKQLMGIKMTVFQMNLSDRQQASSSALSALGVMLLWCNSVACVKTSVILCSVYSLYGFTPSCKWSEYRKKSSQHLYNEVIQIFDTCYSELPWFMMFRSSLLECKSKIWFFWIAYCTAKERHFKLHLALIFEEWEAFHIMRWFTSWHLERMSTQIQPVAF